MSNAGLRLLRGIHAGWPRTRAEGGPDAPDYVLVVRPYAEALMAKAQFHTTFPEFENNYSVAAGAFEPQTLAALRALQAVQDALLAGLRNAFNNSGGLRPRDVPRSLRVAVLLTLMREADLVHEAICFLAAVSPHKSKRKRLQYPPVPRLSYRLNMSPFPLRRIARIVVVYVLLVAPLLRTACSLFYCLTSRLTPRHYRRRRHRRRCCRTRARPLAPARASATPRSTAP